MNQQIVDGSRTDESPGEQIREVVLCVLRHRGHLCILKRSELVGSDRGAWQFVTGYLPSHSTPYMHALRELREETGLSPTQIRLGAQQSLVLPGDWRVHAFLFDTDTAHVDLNWEHTDISWIPEGQIDHVDCVRWGKQVWYILAQAGQAKGGKEPKIRSQGSRAWATNDPTPDLCYER